MTKPSPLPSVLGARFTVQDAAEAGVARGRLRRGDLEVPFRGVRDQRRTAEYPDADPFERQSIQRRIRARQYAPRLRPGQFVSHESAVALIGGPLPLVLHDGRPIDGRDLPVHVSTRGSGPLIRAVGVHAHRASLDARLVDANGVPIAHPATLWAQLGSWNLFDIVALGDYLCRVWRDGPGRRHTERQPFVTIDELRAEIATGRRRGIVRLRQAADLVREDSWSPKESVVRCTLILAGLAEPALNHDVYDANGRFIGCVDLAYPDLKIAIEYQGVLHHSRYAQDVERIAALRAAGWDVIEVTSRLLTRPDELVGRVRAAVSQARSR